MVSYTLSTLCCCQRCDVDDRVKVSSKGGTRGEWWSGDRHSSFIELFAAWFSDYKGELMTAKCFLNDLPYVHRMDIEQVTSDGRGALPAVTTGNGGKRL